MCKEVVGADDLSRFISMKILALTYISQPRWKEAEEL